MQYANSLHSLFDLYYNSFTLHFNFSDVQGGWRLRQPLEDESQSHSVVEVTVKKKRGRPKGSVNKKKVYHMFH